MGYDPWLHGPGQPHFASESTISENVRGLEERCQKLQDENGRLRLEIKRLENENTRLRNAVADKVLRGEAAAPEGAAS